MTLRPIATGTALVLALLAILSSRTALADETKVFEDVLPAGAPDHFFLEFDVPVGTAEIEVNHASLDAANILDFGLNDPAGYRGWGGGTSEKVIVNASAATRAYVPGPLTPGKWKVVVGKAKVPASSAKYHVEVTLRTTATLAAQTDRKKYVAAAPLETTGRYYAVDFHAHSRESTDAKPTLDEMLDVAEANGLDAIEISDHNTITQLDYFVDAQARHPKVLLVPGIEFTTYAGHANAIGATKWVDHKIGQPGVTMTGAAQEIVGQGALLSLNHPALDVGDLCIGCAWKHEVPLTQLSAVEIQTGKYTAITYWEGLAAKKHVAPIGGSDDHRAGKDLGALDSPIGEPATMVFAKELSVKGILDGIASGNTVVKLFGAKDPMVVLTATSDSGVASPGGTATGGTARIHLSVTGTTAGDVVNLVKNGAVSGTFTATGETFEGDVDVEAPATGEDRYRAEVLVKTKVHTTTGYLYVAAVTLPADGGSGVDAGNAPNDAGALAGPSSSDDSGCGCTAVGTRSPALFGGSLTIGLVLSWLLRRARKPSKERP